MMTPADALAGPKNNGGSATTETVADILDREVKHLISEWLARVQKESDLMHIKLNHVERTGHLPYLLHDVVARLRLDAGRKLRFRRLRPSMGICGISKATQQR